MPESNGYLSKDRDYLNRGQRQRRARQARIDYYPSREALAIIQANLSNRYPLNSLTGVLDAIVTAWADASGIK